MIYCGLLIIWRCTVPTLRSASIWLLVTCLNGTGHTTTVSSSKELNLSCNLNLTWAWQQVHSPTKSCLRSTLMFRVPSKSHFKFPLTTLLKNPWSTPQSPLQSPVCIPPWNPKFRVLDSLPTSGQKHSSNGFDISLLVIGRSILNISKLVSLISLANLLYITNLFKL